MNNCIRNINEGDEDYTEGKERKIVNEEEENKNVSNKKLGNVGIMSKVLANEIKVTASNTYKIDFRIQLELISKTIKPQNNQTTLNTIK